MIIWLTESPSKRLLPLCLGSNCDRTIISDAVPSRVNVVIDTLANQSISFFSKLMRLHATARVIDDISRHICCSQLHRLYVCVMQNLNDPAMKAPFVISALPCSRWQKITLNVRKILAFLWQQHQLKWLVVLFWIFHSSLVVMQSTLILQTSVYVRE